MLKCLSKTWHLALQGLIIAFSMFAVIFYKELKSLYVH